MCCSRATSTSNYAGASREHQEAFRELLEMPDPLIHAYCLGREPPPTPLLAALIGRITASRPSAIERGGPSAAVRIQPVRKVTLGPIPETVTHTRKPSNFSSAGRSIATGWFASLPVWALE